MAVNSLVTALDCVSQAPKLCWHGDKRIVPHAIKKRLRRLVEPETAVFSRMYKGNWWGDRESVSGAGSSLDQTKAVREILPQILIDHNVGKILDLPCGDFNWMRTLSLPVDSYVGADVVPDIIRANQASYGGPKREFRVLDITRSELPRADLLLCRDCLMHLSYPLISRAITQILRSEITYLLTTSYLEGANKCIETGSWFPINLTAEPFRFPAPLLEFQDGPDVSHRLALWRIADLREALAGRTFGV